MIADRWSCFCESHLGFFSVGSPVFENDGLRCCERCNELYKRRTERAESVLVTSKQPKRRPRKEAA